MIKGILFKFYGRTPVVECLTKQHDTERFIIEPCLELINNSLLVYSFEEERKKALNPTALCDSLKHTDWNSELFLFPKRSHPSGFHPHSSSGIKVFS